MNKVIWISVFMIMAMLNGCAEKKNCNNSPVPVEKPTPAPVVEAPAPVVEEPAPVFEEPAPVVDEKTRAVQ